MAEHYSPNHTRARRRRRRRAANYGSFALCAAAILLVSLGITRVIDWAHRPDTELQAESSASSGAAQVVLAPLPMAGGDTTAAQTEYGPAQQTDGGYTVLAHDASVIRQAARGQVSLDYFSDAAFVGDSLTEGFTEYSINLSGALICGYVGIGPNDIVNRTTVTHAQRGQEVVLDVLAAQQPKKVYVLLGTNTLVNTGSDDKFLAYYGQMLDDLKSTLGDGALIYVQSIPPVRPEVAAEKPGLESSHLKTVNESLAELADEKGCLYLDLWEALADADGNLNTDYAQPDGIHLTAGNGYTAWVSYLRAHTRYAADNEWTPGTAFAAG